MYMPLSLGYKKIIYSHFMCGLLATRVAERAMAALKESRKRRRRQDLDVPTWTGKSGTAGAPKAFLMQQQQLSPSTSSSLPKQRFGTTNTFNPSVAAGLSDNGPGRFGRVAAIAGNSRPQPGIKGSSTEAASSSSLLAGMLERKRLEQGGLTSSRSQTSSRDSSPPTWSSDRHVVPAILQDGSQESLITTIRDYMLEHGGRVRSADLVEHFQQTLTDVEQLVFKKMLKGIAVLERSSMDGEGWWKLKQAYY